MSTQPAQQRLMAASTPVEEIGTEPMGSQHKQDDTESCPPAKSARVNSPLLALPAELRSRIWEYAVVAPYVIDIVVGETRPPPLVALCRQVRKETASMWYDSNIFACEVHDCDGTVAIAWARHMKKYDKGDEERPFYHWYSGQANWPNMMVWAKELYDNDAYFEDIAEFAARPPADHWDVITSVHAIIGLAKKGKAPWEQAERTLQLLHFAVTATDREWA
ncbi:hypothetical protein LTR85_011711 [Meristemomyces frigidus]|nr:hypothetical protein LTR85_011711 [Meristemomyces frigidus]